MEGAEGVEDPVGTFDKFSVVAVLAGVGFISSGCCDGTGADRCTSDMLAGCEEEEDL